MKRFAWLEPRTVSLLVALTIALAILVHPAFLLIGFGITIFVLIEAVADAMAEHAHHTKVTHRHP